MALYNTDGCRRLNINTDGSLVIMSQMAAQHTHYTRFSVARCLPPLILPFSSPLNSEGEKGLEDLRFRVRVIRPYMPKFNFRLKSGPRSPVQEHLTLYTQVSNRKNFYSFEASAARAWQECTTFGSEYTRFVVVYGSRVSEG